MTADSNSGSQSAEEHEEEGDGAGVTKSSKPNILQTRENKAMVMHS